MTDDQVRSKLAALLRTLKPKTMEPVSAKVLNTWIAQAEGQLGDEAKGGRLGWLIASSVAVGAVQRALDEDGRQLFLLKGGTLLQHRLNATARTTKDVDGLVRGDMDAFFAVLEDVLDEPWGPLTLRRGEVEVIDVPTKLIKPRQFHIILNLRGVTWRRIQFEVSPDEAGIGGERELIEPPPLAGFGCPILTCWWGSRCGSRSRRSSMLSPTRTSRRDRSTTALAMSLTYSCSVTSSPRPACRRWQRCERQLSPCSTPGQPRPPSSGD